MPEVTLDHIRQAAKWAKNAADEPRRIDGLKRRYEQDHWDCGTACCLWGAAHILAGNGPATSGPSSSWWRADTVHRLVYRLLDAVGTTPIKMLGLLNAAAKRQDFATKNFSGLDLSTLDLRDEDFSGANLQNARLDYARLQHVNMTDANLCEASLVGACLFGAKLVLARLRHADLSNAWLGRADLTGADLHRADLTGADLRDACVMVGNQPCRLSGL